MLVLYTVPWYWHRFFVRSWYIHIIARDTGDLPLYHMIAGWTCTERGRHWGLKVRGEKKCIFNVFTFVKTRPQTTTTTNDADVNQAQHPQSFNRSITHTVTSSTHYQTPGHTTSIYSWNNMSHLLRQLGRYWSVIIELGRLKPSRNHEVAPVPPLR